MITVIWVGFVVMVVLLVTLDLGVFHKEHRAISLPEALGWTAFWISLALVFNAFVVFLYAEGGPEWFATRARDLTGREAGLQFFTGFVLEKSLSVDNIFVIAMIFAYFRVPLAEQHRVLFWGILGAVVLRGIMIGAGATLMARFEWVTYVFGGLLLLSAARMLVIRHDNFQPDRNWLVRLVRRVYPVTDQFDGGKFFTTVNGVRSATPLLLALVLVETSDVMFAIDSIPAIFAVTQDPFLVFTSNVFAILGLRSLYFALAGLMDRFRYLKVSLVFLLAYIGIKMLLAHHHPIPTGVSLAIIGGILSVGLIGSIFHGHRDTAPLVSPLRHELAVLVARTVHQGKRAVILLLGSSVLILGVALIVLPGPATLVIPLGLAILALEFRWARRWLRRIRVGSGRMQRRLKKRVGRPRRGTD